MVDMLQKLQADRAYRRHKTARDRSVVETEMNTNTEKGKIDLLQKRGNKKINEVNYIREVTHR